MVLYVNYRIIADEAKETQEVEAPPAAGVQARSLKCEE